MNNQDHQNNTYAFNLKREEKHISEVESGRKGYYCMGCGEEMEGHSGQFASDDYDADDVADKLGEWVNSKLLYSARNGDSVFVDRSGATAWHVLETNEIVPLFNTFPEF